MDFKKSLQEKLGDHDPIEVDELILDDLYENVNAFSSDHKKTLELYKNLIHLSLNGLGLSSLTNMPKIDNLQILELRQNRLSGSDINDIKSLYPHLYKLKIGENPIKSLDVFKSLANSQISKLELTNTEAAAKSNYRDELFKLLPNLQSVDNKDKNGEEVESTLYDEEGDEFDDEDIDDEFEDEDDFEDEEDEDFEDDDGEEEEEKPKKKKKGE